MTLKMHLFYSHLDVYPKYCGAFSDENGERFHQDISLMEQWYTGRWTTAMLDATEIYSRHHPQEEGKEMARIN